MVFRHYRQDDFVLRYPCCETFIDQGFCIACIGKADNVLDDYSDGKIFPYLLYVGYYISCSFLREMPVCHINVDEAKRIMSTIINEFGLTIKVWDTKGKCHLLRNYRGDRADMFYNVLYHYVLSSVSTCVLHVPLSNLYLTEQYMWAIKNRTIEILEVCGAISSRTVSGYKRKKGVAGCDKQVCEILGLAYGISMEAISVLQYIDLENMEQLESIENALK